MKGILLLANFHGPNPLADGSVKFTLYVDKDKIEKEDISKLFMMHNNRILTYITPDEKEEISVSQAEMMDEIVFGDTKSILIDKAYLEKADKLVVKKEKSQSQLLRGVIFAIYEETDHEVSFDQYYSNFMNGVIEHARTKRTPYGY